MNKSRILVVDDEEIARRNLSHVLTREGYEVDCAQDGAAALALLAENEYQLMLTDLRMPGIDGLELLRQTKQSWPDTEVVMITAHANASSAVEAMSGGAFYYVEKPFRLPDVRKIVGEATQKAALKRENSSLRAALDKVTSTPRILSNNPEMMSLIARAEAEAPSDACILICGESGTGRTTLARYIHERSHRRTGELVIVDCAAQAGEALATSLFGGSGQTGAVVAADQGTLLLTNIGSADDALQRRLTRLLENKEFVRNGEHQVHEARARVLVTAGTDLQERVEQGTFRQELLYRLNVITLALPPLRKRRGDVPALAMLFLTRSAQKLKRNVSEISPEAFDLLLAYAFPGNVSELENMIERAVAQAGGSSLTIADLPPELANPGIPDQDSAAIKTLEMLEREHILKTLEHTGGNRALTAQLLGIDRVSLWRKLRRYNEDV